MLNSNWSKIVKVKLNYDFDLRTVKNSIATNKLRNDYIHIKEWRRVATYANI